MSENTSGFYKYEEPFLHCGPNFVYDAEFTLRKDDLDELLSMDIFPVDGWYWFDSIEEARAFFNIPEPIVEELPNP